jgi:dienelactone hydrolase
MDQGTRAQVMEQLRLEPEPEHRLALDGLPFVGGAVRRQRISYQTPSGRLSAWLLHPSAGAGPWPGVLALHPHSDAWPQGGDELAGQRGQREHHYGVRLAARGFCVLCPDLPGFGQQQAAPGMPSGHRWEELLMSSELIRGRSLLALTIDQLRPAVSALLDFERTADLTIAAVGYGLGARTAAWLAFADQRVGAVWMHAGLGQQQVLLARGRLPPRHNLLPGMLALGVDQADIVADILPRSLGISYGSADTVAPPEAVAPVLAAVRAAHARFPHAHLDIAEGAYDHRFPLDVQDRIADRLLAWMR